MRVGVGRVRRRAADVHSAVEPIAIRIITVRPTMRDFQEITGAGRPRRRAGAARARQARSPPTPGRKGGGRARAKAQPPTIWSPMTLNSMMSGCRYIASRRVVGQVDVVNPRGDTGTGDEPAAPGPLVFVKGAPPRDTYALVDTTCARLDANPA